jgi:hypothetical protein
MIEPRLVYRASPAEQYDGLSFLVLLGAPILVGSPWWLAVSWLAGAWMLTR